jgi:uncharacterized membrane protein
MTAPTTTAPTTDVSKSSALMVSKHRVDALTDGVFAIVMTLLVLELKIPDFPRNASVGEIGHALAHERPVIFSFVITFMFAALFWYLHHVTLNFIREFKPRLVVLNLAFLMFVSLLPFSVGMLGHFMQNPLAQTLYFGNYFLIAAFLFLQWRSALSLGLIVNPEGREAGVFGIRLAAIPLGALLAIGTAWSNTTWSFYTFMFVLLASRAYSVRKYGKR